MSLLELMGEKHSILRKRSESLWNQGGRVKVTASEWYVLGRIGEEKPSIAQVARLAEMTRQAAHKYIRILADKGLLQLVEQAGNRREKHVCVTPLGAVCLREYSAIQDTLEQQIISELGEADAEKLRQLLLRQWFTEA